MPVDLLRCHRSLIKGLSVFESLVLRVPTLRRDPMAPKKRKVASVSTTGSEKNAKMKGAETPEDDMGGSSDSKRRQADIPLSSPASVTWMNTEIFHSDAKTKVGSPWNFKVSTWNVSGLRAWVKKGGLTLLEKENPDVLVLQEIKCNEEMVPAEGKNFPGYHAYFTKEGKQRGYAGVALYSKRKPLAVQYGFGDTRHDDEARVLTAEYEDFYMVAIYSPNSGAELVRLPYRRMFNELMLEHLKRLDSIKPVIVGGDLNVAHNPIDLAKPDRHDGHACFTKEEREDFTTLLDSGFVDTFRHLYPNKAEAYSFWSYRFNARAINTGWRLDYILLSQRLADNLCDCVMRSKVTGSDHCPVTAFLSM